MTLIITGRDIVPAVLADAPSLPPPSRLSASATAVMMTKLMFGSIAVKTSPLKQQVAQLPILTLVPDWEGITLEDSAMLEVMRLPNYCRDCVLLLCGVGTGCRVGITN